MLDMAAVQMANELDIEVHLSTEPSISNFESLKFHTPYCDRVVLERELNMTMISSIYQKIQEQGLLGRNGEEMEAFAHGALCIAVLGRCEMRSLKNGEMLGTESIAKGDLFTFPPCGKNSSWR